MFPMCSEIEPSVIFTKVPVVELPAWDRRETPRPLYVLFTVTWSFINHGETLKVMSTNESREYVLTKFAWWGRGD